MNKVLMWRLLFVVGLVMDQCVFAENMADTMAEHDEALETVQQFVDDANEVDRVEIQLLQVIVRWIKLQQMKQSECGLIDEIVRLSSVHKERLQDRCDRGSMGNGCAEDSFALLRKLTCDTTEKQKKEKVDAACEKNCGCDTPVRQVAEREKVERQEVLVQEQVAEHEEVERQEEIVQEQVRLQEDEVLLERSQREENKQ
jgi:hypothetical protein